MESGEGWSCKLNAGDVKIAGLKSGAGRGVVMVLVAVIGVVSSVVKGG